MAKDEETSQRRITSADVARASGVSRATVSYVLNNDTRQSIPLETRERVLKAAQLLGYQPFTPARILRAGHSQVVLAVLPFEQVDPQLAGVLKELEERLASRGLTLICYFGLHLYVGKTHPASNVTPAVILSYADTDDPAISAFLQQFHVPILPVISNKSVQEAVGRMQADYLLQHKDRLLVFAASEREDVHFLAQSRLMGVRRVCTQRGKHSPLVRVIPSLRDKAQAVIHDLLALNTLPLGICCYNDEVAFAVLAALADEGIVVPEDAAVVGCDNIPLAQFSIPALTTIQFDREHSLELLVETIVAVSRGEAATEMPQNKLSVIERASA